MDDWLSSLEGGIAYRKPKRLLTLLPGLTARCKRLVIDKATSLKHRVEDALLSFCRTDAVFIRFTHTATIAPLSVNSKHVLSRRSAQAAQATRYIPGVNVTQRVPGFRP